MAHKRDTDNRMNLLGETPMQCIDRLCGEKQELLAALVWIAKEAAEYADGAEDATPAARFCTLVEQRANEVIGAAGVIPAIAKVTGAA